MKKSGRLLAYHWTNVCLSKEDQSRDQTGIVGTKTRNQELPGGLERQFSLAGFRGLNSSHPLRSTKDRIQAHPCNSIRIVGGSWAIGCYKYVYGGEECRKTALKPREKKKEGEKM